MKLEHVSIRNYRSIKELDIDFEVSCKVLVGINESGKSNILNALHLLHPEVQPSSKDIRDPIKGEPQPTEAFVRFVFSFSEDEGAEIYDTVKPRFLSKNFDEAIIRINDNDLSLYAFCLSREGIYSANLLTSQKHYLYWAVSRRSGIFPHWKKVMPGCPATVSVAAPDGVKRLLQEYEIVNTKDFPDIPEQYLQPLDAEFLNAIVGQVSSTKTKEWLPKTLFWRYSDDLLLPSKINIAAFCAAPDMCVPLKHMFNLHNIWEIKTAIDTAKDGSANALKNLLARVADTATQHFHEVWKEPQGIKLSLTVDGDDIAVSVSDTSNQYELSQRSNGFKRFITFLLLVSAGAKTRALSNTLLLIDEPEKGLHPSGCRYLRDELIKLSEDNQVVYSTHSVFMIDDKSIDRHFIVKKDNEITTVARVSDANVLEDEVISQALGQSAFSNLKDRKYHLRRLAK